MPNRTDPPRARCSTGCGDPATVVASLPADQLMILLCDDHARVVETLGADVRRLSPPRVRRGA